MFLCATLLSTKISRERQHRLAVLAILQWEMAMEGVKNYLIDMDGVILRGDTLIPGAAEFIHHLRDQAIPFLIFTNNSQYTPRDLQVRLHHMGLDVPSEDIFMYALATAQFLHSHR